MPEVKLGTEYDPMAGARIEYVQDGDILHIRSSVEMESCMRLAHEMRAAESKTGRFKGVLKGGFKSIGFTPMDIFRRHPELIQDPEHMKELFETLYPKWKTTNAKLGRNKR